MTPPPETGQTLLRALARRLLRRNAFCALQGRGRVISPPVFRALLAVLLSFRVYAALCLLIAWQGWGLDPQTWASNAATAPAGEVTPFHGYPNPFGWRWGFQLFVDAHNVTGALLFICCLVPLFSTKGGPWHVRFGRFFIALWLLHLLDGLLNSGQILIARGFEPTRYYSVLGEGFSLYLYIQFAFVSSLVIDFLAHGMAALQLKNRPPSRPLRLVMIALPVSSALFGLGIASWGASLLVSADPPATVNTVPFAITYLVQIPAYLFLCAKNLLYWARPEPRRWLHGWLTEHQRNMMFCVQVTLYTGMANVTHRFAPELTPLFFGAIDIGFFAWLLVKERALRRSVARSRFALALVSALRGGKRGPAAPLGTIDQRWLNKLFDLDRSGTLDQSEVCELLAAQGLQLTDDELERLNQLLDEDGDGRVDRRELGHFLAEQLARPATDDDELALIFRSLDNDGDGRITAEELRVALAGEDGEGDEERRALVDHEVDAVMAAADLDHNGAIDFEELRAALKR